MIYVHNINIIWKVIKISLIELDYLLISMFYK